MQAPLVSTAQAGTIHGVKIIVYGRAGVGKTRMIRTAPNPVILSAENGLLSLRKFNLPVWIINSLADLHMAYQWAWQSAEAQQFETVCLDSVSEIAEVVLAAEKAKSKDGRAAYGQTNDQILQLFRAFRNLPNKHVYFTAKQEWDKDEQSGLMLNRPQMPGKTLTVAIPYMFDEIFQLVVSRDQKGQEISALRCRPDHQNEAKDRSGTLAEWEPPDLNHIFGKIMRG